MFALWLTWAATTAATVWLARRFVTRFPVRVGILLALLPLVFTGEAFVRGELYGPADLYYQRAPWKAVAAENGVSRTENPILSDLAFANLPWRAAVREAFVNGRLPLWNRFVLGGNPLLGTAQSGVFHPSTWLGIFLPLALSWTFSCAFTIFLALVAGYLFCRDFCRSDLGALTGAVGWGFSTYVLFWDGWAVGPSIATLPLLLLGLRRLARGEHHALATTVAALVLTVAGGHPETLFHSVAAGGAYFLAELFARGVRRRAGRAIGGSLAAGLLAACLSAPVLLPLLEAVPHSAEYAGRRAALAGGRGGQSVAADEAARRTLPDVLPFAHGIFGRSPVQDSRQDGSGMPLAYAGAVLFPLAIVGLRRSAGVRERWVFLGFVLAGVAYGASAPVLLDLTSRLPGFALALNYRLVFLAPLGLAGLAALGADRLPESRHSLGVAATAVAAALMFAYVLAVPVFRDRGLTAGFTRPSLAFEVVPVVLLLAASFRFRRRLAGAALFLLVAQRFLEMRGVYPTLPAGALAPPLPVLSTLPTGGDPYRIVAAGETFRPNAAALYRLEDVRGYESLVLDRFAETYPMWCRAQFASFNRVDDLTRPFLSFLNVRYAIAEPASPAPGGWRAVAQTREGSILENPRALPRAFVPRQLRVQPDARRRLEEMREAADFSDVAWLDEAPLTLALSPRAGRGDHRVTVREIGTDLIVEADVRDRVLVATSVPDWPGWRAKDGAADVPLLTVNHAFVGFSLAPGRHVVRLHYLPSSFLLGSALSAGAVIALLVAAVIRRRRGLR